MATIAISALVAAGCEPAAPASTATAPAGGAASPASTPAPNSKMSAGTSAAAGNDMLWNSTFAEGTMQPWTTSISSPAAGSADIVGEEVCLKLDAGGTNAYDIVMRQRPVPIVAGHSYQVRFKAHATSPTKLRPKIAQVGPPYTEYWSAVIDVTSKPETFTGTLESKVGDEGAELAIMFGGDLAGKAPLTVCLDDIEVNDPKFEIPAERAAGPLAKIRVNQVGYFPDREKSAVLKAVAPEALEWQLVDASGAKVMSGKTRPLGEDHAAGERVHLIDFSAFKTVGKGYKLKVGKDESLPFDVRKDLYSKLKYDALAFFYQQRSGIEIAMPYAGGAEWARPAGHPGDKSVPCAPEAKCSYSLDVSGGWYDAGDHGKYVVNGGISLWTLQNQWERAHYLGAKPAADDFGDGKMNIPERKNGAPDILDEARWEMEWMLKMQVPAGHPLSGMAHHKIHGESWSPIPTRPEQDPVKRFLRPVTTSATLNLAATAAQAARLWKTLDPTFSKKCLDAAEIAWAAALKNPHIVAEGEVKGGGAYGDSDFEDETYWAAAELFITTGKPEYKKAVEDSRHHKTISTNAGGASSSMSWDQVAALGKISLAVVPNGLGKPAIDEQRKQIIGAADTYLGYIRRRAYRVPLESDSRYPWGSNSFILNNMVVMGLAYDFTHDAKYVSGVVDGMDYLLGKNPKVQSYVSGYGSRPLHNPHHRFWAHQKDPKLPSVPPGVVSGGPNSAVQDPYAKQVGLPGCAPQQCFVDHIESWSTNEIAINWNAPLAWAAAFLDEVERAR